MIFRRVRHTTRGRGGRGSSFFGGISLAAGLATVAYSITAGLPVSVFAVHDNGMFELDGNTVHDASTTPPYDWNSLFDSSGHRIVTPDPINGPVTADTFLSDAATPDSSYFSSNGAGVKDIDTLNNWGCTTLNNPLSKDDLLNAYAAVVQVPANAADNAGDTVLYLGSERGSNNGTSFAGFWLFKDKGVHCDLGAGGFTGSHSVGDLLVVSNYTNGGLTQDVCVFSWTGVPASTTDCGGGTTTQPLKLIASGGVCGSAPGNDNACAIANSAAITTPWSPTSHDSNTFVEAGLDLTALLGSSGDCFTTFLAETRSSAQLTATLKDFSGGQMNTCLAPPIVTTATPGGTTNPLGTTQHDHATITGSPNRPAPSGSITFTLCTPTQVTSAGCPAGSGTTVGNAVPIVAGAADSANVNGGSTPNTNTVGKYCWRADYTPDTAGSAFYLASSETNATTECFTVVPSNPSISTNDTGFATSIAVGQASTIGDVATLTNGFQPTGTVTFTLYANSSCTTAATPAVSGTGTVSLVNSNYQATFSTSWTPSSTGTYYWKVSYGGDARNVGAPTNANATECGGAIGVTNEQVLVNPVSPGVTTNDTTYDHANLVVGTQYTNVGDGASITSGFQPSGTVTFTLYSDASCTTAVNPQPTVNGGSANPATVSGGSASFAGTWTPQNIGTYYWKASYSGDSNNNPANECGGAEGVTNETITVIKASPSISTNDTTYDHSGLIVGTQYTNVGDSSSLSGGFNTTGTVTFTLYSDASCTTAVNPQPSVNGGSANPASVSGASASFAGTWTPQAIGTYYWKASYSGDGRNNPSTQCGGAQGVTNETITVVKASPSISTNDTTYDHSGLIVGTQYTNVGDSSSLSGGFNTTGTVTFTLYSDASCSTAVNPQPTVNGGSANPASVSGTSASFAGTWTPQAIGTYYWKASYSGDGNNNPSTQCGGAQGVTNETITVGKASPAVVTDDTGYAHSGLVVGTQNANVGDSASITGGFAPTGTVTFTLYSDASCTTAVVPQPTVNGGSANPATVGGASASFSATWTPQTVGTYYWKASYSGDGANNPAIECGGSEGVVNETITVVKASPAISTVSDVASATILEATPVGDVATITGAFNPSQPITFALVNSSCTPVSPAVGGTAAIVDNAGTLTAHFTTTWTPQATGTYYWTASYPGDARNNPVAITGCGDSAESIVVSTSESHLSKTEADTSRGDSLPPSLTSITDALSGDTIVYQLTYNNAGAGNADSVTITDSVPAGTSYVSCAAANGFSCSETAGVVTFSKSQVGPHTTVVAGTFTVTITATGGFSISNSAGVTTAAESQVVPSNTVTAVGPLSSLLKAETDLTRGPAGYVMDVSGPGITWALNGDNLSYKLTYTNAGQGPAQSVTVTDTVPTGTSFVSCAPQNGFTCGESAGVVTFHRAADVPAGTTALVVGTFTVTITATGGFTITNTAAVTSAVETTPIPSNTVSAIGPLSSLVKAERDLGPDGSGSGAFVTSITNAFSGDVIEYRLTYNNSGMADAPNVVVTDAVPAGTSYVSCSGSNGFSCSQSAGTVTFSIASVGGDDTTVVVGTFQVKITAKAPFTITNVAGVTNDVETQPISSNTVTATGPLSSLAKAERDLGPTGANTSAAWVTTIPAASPADQIQYRLTYTNSGSATAHAATITDVIPAHETFLSCDTGCTTNGSTPGSTVTWAIGDQAAGATVVVTFTVVLDSTFPVGSTTITNVAAVTTTEEGTLPSNSVPVTVTVAAAVLGITAPNTGGPGLGRFAIGLLLTALGVGILRRRRRTV